MAYTKLTLKELKNKPTWVNSNNKNGRKTNKLNTGKNGILWI